MNAISVPSPGTDDQLVILRCPNCHSAEPIKAAAISEGVQVVICRQCGEGWAAKPEPEHFRVVFPGGDVDIVRTTNGEYWVHLAVHKHGDGSSPHEFVGEICDARLDVHGKHASDTDAGDFADENLYHVALRVKASRVVA